MAGHLTSRLQLRVRKAVNKRDTHGYRKSLGQPLPALAKAHRWLPVSPSRVKKAIAKRGAPTPEEVVAYIHGRCGCETFARSLRAELLKLPRPARSARYEVFRGRGRLTATGWQRLFLLTKGAVLDGRYSAEGISNQLLVDGRTIRAATKAIDIRWGQINDGFGWKWVVEVVLRRCGYVPWGDDPLLRMA